ncbi:peptidase S41 [Mycoplasma bovis]|nr:peptidase S41 [Mycoplasmopsis bovis]MBT1370218.1 peptidase S41 [Mycoplasmopsis bovis]MBT1371575.1 peptidase S41 [Mycoplasmopsis bovis]MBT1376714.1 peptidase S41 [Mycoplasmopsis bovis]MBT1382489.1 peptidase S41 [Mycoplasmopsis bovis]
MKISKIRNLVISSAFILPFTVISATCETKADFDESALKDFLIIPLAKELNGQIDRKNNKIKMYMHNDVAYVGIKEFLKSISTIIKHDKLTFSFNNDKVKLVLKTNLDEKNNPSLTVDYKLKKIIVSNYKFFTEILKKYERGEEKLKISFLKRENQNLNEEFEFDLKKYNIDILKGKDDLYLPQILLNQVLLNESNIQTYFNEDVFNIFRFAESLAGFGSITLKMSPKNSVKNIPDGLKNFQLKYYPFLFDYYYGIKLDKNKSYKEFFNNYKTDILSNDSDTHYLSTKKIISDLDDPHTAYKLDGYYDKSRDLYSRQIANKKRTNDQIEISNQLQKYYFKNITEYQNVYTSDNKTSVISFKAFEEDSASHIEKSLKEAKEKGVKNIVFNLTLNGGGFIGAAFEIMGFMTDKPFKSYTYNPLSGEKKIELIQSKYPKYDFNYYVLTSPYAFSAGNIFPQMVKDNNVGKVIGYKTFGGASAISYAILPTGDIIQLSSNTVFTDKHFRTTEFGIEPNFKFKYDLSKNPEKLYDLTNIQNIVNNISQGKFDDVIEVKESGPETKSEHKTSKKNPHMNSNLIHSDSSKDHFSLNSNSSTIENKSDNISKLSAKPVNMSNNVKIAIILSTVVIAILAIAISVYFVIKKQKRKLNLKNEI